MSALALAAIGIYGLMAYSVEQRTQEIGIRLALGAGTGQVRTMVVFQGMRLALVGVVIGIAAAFGLARFISELSFRRGAVGPAGVHRHAGGADGRGAAGDVDSGAPRQPGRPHRRAALRVTVHS